MQTFTVLYRDASNVSDTTEPYTFKCQADDREHAIEQCLNAYPQSVITSATSDFQTARDEFIGELRELARDLIPTIADDYRAYEYHDPEDDVPSMLVTIGADESGWSYQTGDNSFSGGAYHYATWGVQALYRNSDPAEFARLLVEDLESAADDETRFFYDSNTDTDL